MVLPLVAGAAIVGAGLTAVGGIGAAKSAKRQAQIQQQMIQTEMQIEAQRRQAMEIDAARKRLEAIRAGQFARSMALTTATSQGAGGGSGLQGAFGGVSGQTGFNLLGIFQNLEIGRNIFDLNQQLSQQKIALAGEQAKGAKAGAIASLGGSIMKVGSMFA